MLKNAQYIYDNIIIADEVQTTKKYCKKAQVGVDLTLKNVYAITTPGVILTDKSVVSEYAKIEAHPVDMGDWSVHGWRLPRGTYLLELNEGVSIPGDVACYIIQRSSLNRSGCTVVSSLWDNGYTSADENGVNTITIRLNVDTDKDVIIEQNARVVQIIAMSTDEAELYNGQFQGGLLKSNLL